jgi:DNA-binding response OmpR family regulator
MVTAFGSEDVAADALRLGADDYMAKPLRIQNLCFRIQRNLEKARLRANQELLNRQLRETTLELTDRLQKALGAAEGARELARSLLEAAGSALPPETIQAIGAALAEPDPGAAVEAARRVLSRPAEA